MTAYADYEFYANEYKGKAVKSADDFDRLALTATQYVNKVTFGRISESDIDDCIRNACCAAVDVLSDYDSSGRTAVSVGKTSEKVGDYSVTYSSDYFSENVKEGRLYNAVKLWLPDNLLYRGGVRYGNKRHMCNHPY